MDLLGNELTTKMERSLSHILCKTVHNSQTGILSGRHTIVEQELLDLLRKDIIRETLKVHMAKLFGTNTAADRPSKWLLTSTMFLEPIATFLRRQTDTAHGTINKKYNTLFWTRFTIDIVQMFIGLYESTPSRYDSGSYKSHPQKDIKTPVGTLSQNVPEKGAIRHLSFPKSS